MAGKEERLARMQKAQKEVWEIEREMMELQIKYAEAKKKLKAETEAFKAAMGEKNKPKAALGEKRKREEEQSRKEVLPDSWPCGGVRDPETVEARAERLANLRKDRLHMESELAALRGYTFGAKQENRIDNYHRYIEQTPPPGFDILIRVAVCKALDLELFEEDDELLKHVLSISPKEIKALRAALGGSATDAEVALMWTEMTTNVDPWRTQEEFELLLKKTKLDPSKKRLDEFHERKYDLFCLLFGYFDENFPTYDEYFKDIKSG